MSGLYGAHGENAAPEITPEFLETLAVNQDRERRSALARVQRPRVPGPDPLTNYVSVSLDADKALEEGFFAPDDERAELWAGAFRLLSLIDADTRFAAARRYIEAIVQGDNIANAGFPEFGTSVKREVKIMRVDATLYVGNGSFRKRDVTRRGGWDYIDSPCDYRAFPQLAKSFGGMSGGGIWAVLLNRDGSEFKVVDFALVGVITYQTALPRGRCRLRGHFVRSIYGRAWVQNQITK